MIRQRREHVDRALAGHRGGDRDGCLGDVPDPGGVHLEVFALPVDELPGEQLANDLDGLFEHLLAPRHRRPAPADHVFVEVLAAAHPESEPSVGEDLQRGGLLRDDRGVVTHGRAGDVGEQLDLFGDLGDGAEHRPCIGRMALRRQPREVVVAGHLEVEASALRRNGITDKLFRPALLCHQGVAKTRHSTRVPGHPRQKTAKACPSPPPTVGRRPPCPRRWRSPPSSLGPSGACRAVRRSPRRLARSRCQPHRPARPR